MSYAFTSLKRQIQNAGNGEGKYSPEDLDDMIYDKYKAGKLSDREYQDLCTLLDFVG